MDFDKKNPEFSIAVAQHWPGVKQLLQLPLKTVQAVSIRNVSKFPVIPQQGDRSSSSL